ncbi:MAG: DNA repair protein RadA [Patescibacteria group bacterium]
MSHRNNLYSCTKCGAQTSKWSGRCSECGGWGTLGEDDGAVTAQEVKRSDVKPGKTQSFAKLEDATAGKRLSTLIPCFDRVLSGGLVSGSVTLVGGEPGVGKSTLLAQLGLAMANAGKSVLYVTGEESPTQIRLRLDRLSPRIPDAFSFLDMTQADIISATIRETKPALAIIDSVQTLRTPTVPGEPGNMTQVRASAAIITEAAKQSGVPVILVGQVTKDGDLAGPRLLEHLVDTVFMMEGDRTQLYRILRVVKHRFGSTEESAIMQMTERGLEEVLDPSAAFIGDRPRNVPGSLVTCLTEGARPLLVEVQALVTQTGFGLPTRRATGADLNRISLLLAVLSRRAGVSFGDQDAFINVVGGVEAKDPSIDLALALALVSAKNDRPLPADMMAVGEIGLAGEIRPVPRLDLRLKEAARLGFATAIIPDAKVVAPANMELLKCRTVRDALVATGSHPL